MGTFRVKLDALSGSTVSLSSDGLPPEPVFAIFDFNIPPFYTTDDATAAEYMSVLDNSDLNIGGIFQPVLGSSSLTADFQTGNAIILDGNELNPVTFNGLPAGFTIITAEVVMRLMAQPYSVGVSLDLFLKQANVTESSPFSVPIDTTLHTYTFPFVDVSNTLSVLTGGCGFRIVPVDAIPSFTYLYITGTYETQAFRFTLHTPDELVDEGTEIEVTSEDPNQLLLDEIDEIQITFDEGGLQTLIVPRVDFIINEQNRLVFRFPPFLGFTPPVVTILAIGNGTQFSGSIQLGRLLTIFFTDASGIYRLVADKTNDTLYIQDDPPNTVDVKIPDPFIRTGFIPG